MTEQAIGIAAVLAIVCAVGLAVLVTRMKGPARRALVTAKRVRATVSPCRHEALELAVARIAQELAQRRWDQDGNPDDELRSDWYRWFTGDPDANVDYSRKQQRDLDRLERGEFRHKH